jgi:hypothetical protein
MTKRIALRSHEAGDASEILQRQVEACMARNNCTYIEALQKVRRSQPALWTKYKDGLKNVEPNLREQFVMKAKARGHLLRLVALLDRWGSPDKHFAIGHQSSSVMKALQRVIIVPDHRADEVTEVMTKLASTAYKVLDTMARDQRVGNDELDVLTDVLNQHQDPIRFRPVLLADPRPMYRRKGGIDVSFVDDLLRYMDVAARYGRQHHLCQLPECGSLMISGRGGKRFCSTDCRNKFWSYNRQKLYYIQKKDLSERRSQTKQAGTPPAGRAPKNPRSS